MNDPNEVPEPSTATGARVKYTDAQVLYMLCLALEEGLEGVKNIDLPDVLLRMIAEHWGTADEDTSPDEAEAAFAQLEPYIPDHLRTPEPQGEPSDARRLFIGTLAQIEDSTARLRRYAADLGDGGVR